MNSKIESIRIFKQDDLYYLDIYATLEDEREIKHLHIPKVHFPIETAVFHDLYMLDKSERLDDRLYTYGDRNKNWIKPSITVSRDFFCEKAQVTETSTDEEVFYTVRTEDKITEMTQEEIEKKLGYKIKIIKEKHK